MLKRFQHDGLLYSALLFSLAVYSPVAYAQSYQCTAPSGLAALAARKPADEPRRVKPVAGYTLALSWSPEFCRLRKDQPRHATQCAGQSGSFAFILHGLWPEARNAAYPQWCRATRALPVAEVRQNFCMMPSARLMSHEWAKHGTCMTQKPETYFAISRLLFGAVRFPDMDGMSRRTLTVAQFKQRFAAVNDGLEPGMIRVKINARGWLEEVRLCLADDFRPRRCPAFQRAAPPDAQVKIWRGA